MIERYDKNKIEDVLRKAFNPSILEVIDDSDKHANHYTKSGDEVSHISITIASKNLVGLSKVAQHRLINDALKEFFSMGLHAVSIKVIT